MRPGHRRLIGEACKTLAGILVYVGTAGALTAAAVYVIAATAELKCEICTNPGRALAGAFEPKRDHEPAAVPDLPPDAPTGSIPDAAADAAPGPNLRGALSAQ